MGDLILFMLRQFAYLDTYFVCETFIYRTIVFNLSVTFLWSLYDFTESSEYFLTEPDTLRSQSSI